MSGRKSDFSPEASALADQIRQLPVDQRNMVIEHVQTELLKSVSACAIEELERPVAWSGDFVATFGSTADVDATDQLVKALNQRIRSDGEVLKFLSSRGSGALTKKESHEWKQLLQAARRADQNVKALTSAYTMLMQQKQV